MDTQAAVEPLKRIRAEVEAGPPGAASRRRRAALDFIVGVGSGGFIPLEGLLLGRRAGERVSFRLRAEEIDRFCGHLGLLLAPVIEGLAEAEVELELRAVETPAPREILRAMADAAACGSACGCGCGP
ncbi:MAG: hypothetical protein WHT06_02910 [Desulfobacterales bacterium]